MEYYKCFSSSNNNNSNNECVVIIKDLGGSDVIMIKYQRCRWETFLYHKTPCGDGERKKIIFTTNTYWVFLLSAPKIFKLRLKYCTYVHIQSNSIITGPVIFVRYNRLDYNWVNMCHVQIHWPIIRTKLFVNIDCYLWQSFTVCCFSDFYTQSSPCTRSSINEANKLRLLGHRCLRISLLKSLLQICVKKLLECYVDFISQTYIFALFYSTKFTHIWPSR